MFLVGFLAQKGGVGKSTLSVNLAVQLHKKLKVGILDADPQATLSGWALRRGEDTEGPVVAHVDTAEAVPEAIAAAREDGLELLMIDTPAGVSLLSEVAAELADLCLMPCVPSVFDLDSMSSTTLLLKPYPKKPAHFILNRCGRSRVQNQGAAEALTSEFGYPTVPIFISSRVDIADAGMQGKAFVELESKSASVVKGQLEFKKLGAWLMKQKERLG